ncbi:signal recognition particle receptor beta subunit-domain-containing protein [Kockovaella imperatae]|uniref:Signal recognition particle receptor subunit beta n=1 Tax=Kockovaella imperatae TaxID=4999 RepID=A0A1Y1UNY5_9TREE|nr:signal recognition particle receptor beta subunit-domain-containing protein [Kockovaella imperatae]ORX39712.1 signal recognition particle receptor beta subunit-domain-containing protein [Kockovaella imperatae]
MERLRDAARLGPHGSIDDSLYTRLVQLLSKVASQHWKAILLGLILGYLVFFLTQSQSRTKSRKGRRGTPTALLVGPQDGGKTSLFVNLVQGEHPQTHTSIQVSDTTFALCSSGACRQIRLVDVPGHPRLADEIKKHLEDVSAAIFVVDIVGLVRNSAQVAELLPSLLTLLASTASQRPHGDPIQLLILSHKTDLLIRPSPPAGIRPVIPESTRTTALERLKTILTREMDRLKSARGTQSGKIEGMSRVPSSTTSFWSRLFGGSNVAVSSEGLENEDAEGLIWGGKGPFSWNDVEGVEVKWGCTALGGAKSSSTAAEMKMAKEESDEEKGPDGLDDLRDFLLLEM